MSSLARPSARPFLVAAVSCVALVLLAIGLADRPFSTWSHAEFHGDQGFIWLTWIVDPIPPLLCRNVSVKGELTPEQLGDLYAEYVIKMVGPLTT
jgi:hypothetical protein